MNLDGERPFWTQNDSTAELLGKRALKLVLCVFIYLAEPSGRGKQGFQIPHCVKGLKQYLWGFCKYQIKLLGTVASAICGTYSALSIERKWILKRYPKRSATPCETGTSCHLKKMNRLDNHSTEMWWTGHLSRIGLWRKWPGLSNMKVEHRKSLYTNPQICLHHQPI